MTPPQVGACAAAKIDDRTAADCAKALASVVAGDPEHVRMLREARAAPVLVKLRKRLDEPDRAYADELLADYEKAFGVDEAAAPPPPPARGAASLGRPTASGSSFADPTETLAHRAWGAYRRGAPVGAAAPPPPAPPRAFRPPQRTALW